MQFIRGTGVCSSLISISGDIVGDVQKKMYEILGTLAKL
jgi:hypothetical protein